jgi:hypothetical protein
MNTMKARIRSNCNTAAVWTSLNPILYASEIGFETDTGKIKIGDGATAWNSLAYTLHAHAESEIANLISDLTATASNATYRVLDSASGSHIAGKVAGTYILNGGSPLAVSGTGILYPITLIPIYVADLPTVNGMATKLRIRAIIAVNNIAPTGNFTVGLYPVTSGAGGAGLKIYTTGTLVTGSAAPTVTTPAGSSMTSVAGSDFALPADGIYCLACVTTATVATSSLVHINAILQMRNA